MKCPRDGSELRRHSDKERWRCHQCRGAALSTSELVRSLAAVAPELVAPEGATTLAPTTRESGVAVACPLCTEPMTPVSFEIFEIDRCLDDDLLWFDDWEHVSVMAAAHNEDKRPHLRNLLRSLLVDPDPEPSPLVEPTPSAE